MFLEICQFFEQKKYQYAHASPSSCCGHMHNTYHINNHMHTQPPQAAFMQHLNPIQKKEIKQTFHCGVKQSLSVARRLAGKAKSDKQLHLRTHILFVRESKRSKFTHSRLNSACRGLSAFEDGKAALRFRSGGKLNTTVCAAQRWNCADEPRRGR
jgi:hypothetical protein